MYYIIEPVSVTRLRITIGVGVLHSLLTDDWFKLRGRVHAINRQNKQELSGGTHECNCAEASRRDKCVLKATSR